MRTVLIILGGFVLLGIFLAGGRMLGGAGFKSVETAALAFIPVWLAIALVNLWVGVSKAGYTVAEETPIMLLIFAVPAAAAVFVAWKFS